MSLAETGMKMVGLIAATLHFEFEFGMLGRAAAVTELTKAKKR